MTKSSSDQYYKRSFTHQWTKTRLNETRLSRRLHGGRDRIVHECGQISFYQRPQRKEYALRWQNHPLTNTIKEASRISERKDVTSLDSQEDSMAEDAALTRWYKDDNIYGYFGDNRLDWYITMTNTWTSVLLLSSCNAHAFGQISFNV